MCGIAGILSAHSFDRQRAETSLRTLRGRLHHRGPDDGGEWYSSDGQAALGHTRLAILDLSPAGHQPMLSPDGRFAITFNGEIYNFRELRARLEASGHSFRSDSDTEVLLALYEEHGASMVSELRGMFSFCIWDAIQRSAFLCRDPFGIKPLYYAVGPGPTLAFASELRALQGAGLCSTDLDPAALMRYFRMGSVGGPGTLLKGAAVLPAGHSLFWKAGQVTVTEYWRPTFEPEASMRAREAVACTRAALIDSVRAHFVSDVPVGLFLSGGIDSTVLLALAGVAGQREVATFAVGVDDPLLDESHVARRTAAHFGSRHLETTLGGRQGTDCLHRFLERIDQPSIDGFNTFVVSEFARSQGIKVVLSGIGGDELFGGYPSFLKVPALHRWASAARLIPGLGPLAGSLLATNSSPRMRRLGEFLAHPATMLDAYRSFRGIFTLNEARQLAATFSGCSVADLPDSLPAPQFRASDVGDSMSALELSLYMGHQLLPDSDVMSMSQGLELRVPFVDKQLFSSLSAVPSSLRLRPGKRLLLDAVPEVPEWVARQPKRGFVFPYQRWMSQDWKQAFEAVDRDLPCRSSSWYQRWAVFMLRHWLQRN